MTLALHSLFVEDEADLREVIFENLRLALREFDIHLTHESLDAVEPAKDALHRGQTQFGLVLVDLLWEGVGAGIDARGLEVIKQAAKTRGVVIVAVSHGDTRRFPELAHDARTEGAHVFRYKASLAAASSTGGWEGLASEIAEQVRTVRGGHGHQARLATGRAPGDRRTAFVVHGRDRDRNAAVYRFLRAIGLDPLEWGALVTEAIRDGGGGNPQIFDIVRAGFHRAFGAIAVFTPDDDARLRERLHRPSDGADETELRGQPRANVLLETGYALCYAPERTLIVTLGDVRLPTDLTGMHQICLDGSPAKRMQLVDRLRSMGFDVRTDGQDWLDVDGFD